MRDLIVAFRFLARRKAVVAVAVLTMALALGANTAALSVVRAFLFSSLAVPDADRLFLVAPVRQLAGRGSVVFNDAYPNFQHFSETQRAFSATTAFIQGIASWDDGGEIRSLQSTRATAAFFATMGVSPMLGRGFSPDEEGPSPAPVVVIGHALWRTGLAGDSSVIGRPITINGELVTVIGVMPAGFRQPFPTDVWQPFDIPPNQRTSITGARALSVYARLPNDRPVSDAAAELAAFTSRSIERNAVDNRDYRYVPKTLRDALLDGADATVLLTEIGAVVLLVLAILNLTSLLIAWAVERKHEVAVRLALGAGAGRVARLLLIQSLLVVAAGFVIGVIFAYLGIGAIRQVDLGAGFALFLSELRIDAVSLVVGAAVAFLAAVIAGTLPLWVGGGTDLVTTLRSSSRGTTLSPAALRWQKGMVVVQSALSLVVLVVTALVGLSFRNLAGVPDGFRADRRVVARITLPDARFGNHAARAAFGAALLVNLAQERGLVRAGFSNTLPVSDAAWGGRFFVPGADGALPADPALLHYRRVSPDYLATLAIPLLDGRLLDAHDDSTGVAVALVSAALADRYWPDGKAIGQRIHRPTAGGGTPIAVEIVGVVGNVMDGGYGAPPGETVYVPYAQASVTRLSIVAESSGDPGAALTAVRRALKATDPTVAASSTATLETLLGQANALPRLRTAVLLAFALIALVIAGLGSYGVMRQLVAAREREFAVRLVVGAKPADIGRTVLRQVALLTIPGVTIGLGAAWLLSGALRSFVFGIEPRSVPILLGVGIVVVVLAVATTLPTIRRAMRIDPRRAISAG